nr:MAG TPA: hypothetical protein [Caudoviricetes sp.]
MRVERSILICFKYISLKCKHQRNMFVAIVLLLSFADKRINLIAERRCIVWNLT